MSWNSDPFDTLFDFDGDGVINDMERATEYEVLADGFKDNDDSDDSFDSFADYDLEMAGIDKDDLMFMSDDERRETLEDAGLDPDFYDDF